MHRNKFHPSLQNLIIPVEKLTLFLTDDNVQAHVDTHFRASPVWGANICIGRENLVHAKLTTTTVYSTRTGYEAGG